MVREGIGEIRPPAKLAFCGIPDDGEKIVTVRPKHALLPEREELIQPFVGRAGQQHVDSPEAPSASPFHSVGEGIETVLSPLTAMPRTTGAAALSVGSLGSFAPPPGLARLVIALDNDAEGERAAERPARCYGRAGVARLVVVPEGGDFNDDLVALGPCALRARLHTLLCVRDAAAGRA